MVGGHCRCAQRRTAPAGLSALIEQHTGGVVPDILAVERRRPPSRPPGGTATLPRTRMTIESQGATLLRRANRIAIRHRLGEVVCIIEIVPPGNKASQSAVRSFVEKTCDFLRAGVNVSLVDPFPPGPRDPHSLHKLIWDEIEEVPFEMPADEPLLLAAYRAGDEAVGLSPVAYLEPFRVGATMPDSPPGSIRIRSSKSRSSEPINQRGPCAPPTTATTSNTAASPTSDVPLPSERDVSGCVASARASTRTWRRSAGNCPGSGETVRGVSD